MAIETDPAHPISLFDQLQELLDGSINPIHCTKATLVQVSHALEEIVLYSNLPALMFTGFQKSSYWKQETERYRQLAGKNHQICIFADEPLPEDSSMNLVQIQLRGDDHLRQEWFILILSNAFSVVLCGKDNLMPTNNEASRTFETILSFENSILNTAMDMLFDVLNEYRADLIPKFQAARDTYDTVDANVQAIYITRIMTEIIQFEEKLLFELANAEQMQRQINDHLRRERDFNKQIIESASTFFIAISPDGDVLLVNESIANKLGYEVDELVNTTLFQEIVIAPAWDDMFQLLMQNPTDSNTSIMEMQIRTKYGEIRLFQWEWNIIKNTNSVIENIYGLGLDITDKERVHKAQEAEMELRISLEKERELRQARDTLMTTISHEFRTPLSAILTSVEMLQRYADRQSPEQKEKRFQRIQQYIKHLTQMLDNISDVIYMDSHQTVFQPQILDLRSFVLDVIAEINDSSGYTHQIILDYSVKPRQLQFDKQLVRHIVRNLLSNAVKYSPDGNEITAYVSDGNQYIDISIRDRGVGIEPSDFSQLTQAFYRGGNIRNSNIPGAGIGLRIVHDAVKLHGGELEFDNHPDGGAIFTVRLPMD